MDIIVLVGGHGCGKNYWISNLLDSINVVKILKNPNESNNFARDLDSNSNEYNNDNTEAYDLGENISTLCNTRIIEDIAICDMGNFAEYNDTIFKSLLNKMTDKNHIDKPVSTLILNGVINNNSLYKSICDVFFMNNITFQVWLIDKDKQDFNNRYRYNYIKNNDNYSNYIRMKIYDYFLELPDEKELLKHNTFVSFNYNTVNKKSFYQMFLDKYNLSGCVNIRSNSYTVTDINSKFIEEWNELNAIIRDFKSYKNQILKTLNLCAITVDNTSWFYYKAKLEDIFNIIKDEFIKQENV